MNEWLTAKEIGDAMGMHVSNVLRRATKENWPKRPRQGKGGGSEYQLLGLPDEVQRAAAKYLAEKAARENPLFAAGMEAARELKQKAQADDDARFQAMQRGALEFNRLTGAAKARAEARLLIVSAYKQYLAPYIARRQKLAGVQAFIADYNRQELALHADVYRTVKQVSSASLHRWQTQFDEAGAARLAGNYKADKPHLIDANEEMQTYCMGMVWHRPDIQATNLYEVVRAQVELGKLEGPVPSKSAVRRWLVKLNKEYDLALSQRRNPDDFKNRRQVAWGDAAGNVTRINQLWELDSTPSDVLLTDGRHSIVGAIDVFSRRPIVIVHPTSSAEAVCLLLRKAVMEFGVPEVCKTDNGRDYTSKRVMTALSTLGVEQVLTPPFRGDKKPHIESFFGTWAHGISTLLPGYGGHNVARRQEIRARTSFADRIMAKRKEKVGGEIRYSKGADVEVALSSKELQVIIDEWIDYHYLHEKHRKIGTTPFARWQEHRATIRTVEDERLLDVLLSPVPASGGRAAGIRVATKDAGIVVEGISYFAPELGGRISQSLFCAWNPRDVGQLYVFEPVDHAFVCVAKNPEMAGQGITLAELSKAAQQRQGAEKAAQKEQLRKASRKVNAGEVVTDVLAAAKQRNGVLSGLPHRTEALDSAALRGAQAALSQPVDAERLDRSEFERRREEQLQMDALVEAQSAQPRFRNQMEEFVYYLRQKDVRALTAEEIVKMDRFRRENPKLATMAERLKGGDDDAKDKASR